VSAGGKGWKGYVPVYRIIKLQEFAARWRSKTIRLNSTDVF